MLLNDGAPVHAVEPPPGPEPEKNNCDHDSRDYDTDSYCSLCYVALRLEQMTTGRSEGITKAKSHNDKAAIHEPYHLV